MLKQRTIEGHGMLVCGDSKTGVDYRLTLLSGSSGNEDASGLLHINNASIPIKSFIAGPGRLILEDNQHIDVYVTRSDVHGNAYVQSSGGSEKFIDQP
jgi:hypothetical protein